MISAPRVLIESPTFQNQRIGVARVYEGAQTANALMQGADEIAGLAFRAAAEDAERQGQEMALAASRSDVMGIDPNTGEPIALAAMGNMGRIGSEAYRRVINTRFQQSIEEEIRNQGVILAAEYGNRPDGASLYSAAMADYISSMSQNATGQWRGIIEDTGTSYINRTRATLLAREMSRSRSAMASSGRAAAASAMATREAIVAQLGPSAFGEMGAPATMQTATSPFPVGVTRSDSGTELGFSLPMGETSAAAISAAQGETPLSFGDVGIANAIGLETRVAVQDSVEAGIFDPRALDGLGPAELAADLRGMTTFYTRNQDMSDPETVRHLSRLRFMIGSRDIVGAMREAPELAPYMQHLLADAEAVSDFDTYANRLFSDAINLAELESEEAQLEAQAAAFELSLVQEQAREDAAYTTTQMFTRMSRAAINPTLDQLISEISATRSAIPGERDELRREAMQEGVASQLDAVTQGLFNNLVSDMPNQDEVDRLRAAFQTRNPSNLTPQERPVYNAIERLERYAPDIFDTFNTEFGSYREGGGRFAQAQDEETARQYVETEVLPLTNQFVNARGDDITALADGLTEMVNRAGTMTDGVRNEALNAININAGQAELYQAFEVATDSREVTALRLYAETGVLTEGLPPRSVAAIDRARERIAQTGNTSAFPTAIGRAVQSVNQRIAADEEIIRTNNGVANALSGFSNPSRAEDRGHATVALERQWQRVTGQPLPTDLLTNPEYLGDPQLRSVFNTMYNTPNFMPDIAYDVFTSIGSGAQPQGMEVALAHWQAMRGAAGRNPSVNALSEDEIGMLDMLSEVSSYFGGDEQGRVRFTEAMTSYNQLRHDTGFRDRVESYLEQPLDEFLVSVDGYNDLQSDQRQAVRALAGHLVGMSIAAPQTGSGSSWLKRRLEDQIAQGTPDTGGTVMEFGPSGGLSTRSRYALGNVVPGAEDRFLDYARQQIAATTNAPRVFESDMQLSLAERFVGPLGRRVNLEEDERSVLVPYGEDNMGGVSYQVYRMNPATAEFTPVMHTSGEFEGLPLVISTAERGFRWAESLRSRRERLNAVRTGNAYQELLGQGLYRSGEGLEMMGLPPEMTEQR